MTHPDVKIDDITDDKKGHIWYGIRNQRFYSIRIEEDQQVITTVSYGKIGGKTTINSKTHQTPEKAISYFQRMVRTKEGDSWRSYLAVDFRQMCNRPKPVVVKPERTQKSYDIDKSVQKNKSKLVAVALAVANEELIQEPYNYDDWGFN